MKKKYKVRIRYTNIFMMPVVITKRISADELEELSEREDVEVISVIDMNASKKVTIILCRNSRPIHRQ